MASSGITSLSTYLTQHPPTQPAPTPNVLLVAYQCAPNGQSVSQIGWHWYVRLAQQVPTTLVTHIRNRPDLTKAGAPLAHSDIIYIDTEWFAGPLYRLAIRLFPNSEHVAFMLVSLDAYVYDFYAVKQLRQRQRQGAAWDVVHVVTPVTPKLATRLHRLKKPLILGPMNGNVPAQKNFPELMRKDSAWLYPFRRLARFPQWLWRTLSHATILLAATKATVANIPHRHHPRCLAMLENGVDLNVFQPAPYPSPPSAEQPLQLVFVGRLIPVKAVNLLLTAVARCQPDLAIHLNIIGYGAMQQEWMALSHRLGIADYVQWYGALSPAELVRHLQHAHALCLPSVRESGGAVLLEAMACARPVIAVNFGGPGEIVDDSVGHLVSPDSSEAVITQLAATFHAIVNDYDGWRQRGENGRRRVEACYSWDAKVAQGIALYQSLISGLDLTGSENL